MKFEALTDILNEDGTPRARKGDTFEADYESLHGWHGKVRFVGSRAPVKKRAKKAAPKVEPAVGVDPPETD